MRTDLHVHTYYSDGRLSPDEVVSLAAENGVELLAVTDHDTMRGSGEVGRCAAEKGLKTVRGCEISAYEGNVKIHTLGYCPDENNADFAEFLKSLCRGAQRRAEDIVFKLNGCGFKISIEEVAEERFSPDTPIHVMHVARACAKKGYAPDEFRFFSAYLMYGKPAFSNVCRPSPRDTCEVISAAGGFVSLAHPGRIDMPADELKKLIRSMKSCGLGGIEAVYSTHTTEQTAYYINLARELSLEVTGGSDTHFCGGNRAIGFPLFEPDADLLRNLKID